MGNPGDDYATTRHNVGWWAADLLTKGRGAVFNNEGQSRTARISISDATAIVAYPLTYVNRSGGAARALLQRHRSDINQLIVVTDDINLAPGKLRIRPNGGAGGHNGLKSVIDALGDNAFPRIRIGVGKQSEQASQIDHVLGEPSDEELDAINAAVQRAAEAVEAIIAEGVDKAMNRFN